MPMVVVLAVPRLTVPAPTVFSSSVPVPAACRVRLPLSAEVLMVLEPAKVRSPVVDRVALVALLVLKLRALASLVPRSPAAPKLLPPWTKAAPVPVVLQVATMLLELRQR